MTGRGELEGNVGIIKRDPWRSEVKVLTRKDCLKSIGIDAKSHVIAIAKLVATVFLIAIKFIVDLIGVIATLGLNRAFRANLLMDVMALGMLIGSIALNTIDFLATELGNILGGVVHPKIASWVNDFQQKRM